MSSPQTPCSPERRTRQQEKNELQHLNDRFVTYIDRVRRIREESESRHLQESVLQENDLLKIAYESELRDARTLIDDLAKEKARFQMQYNRSEERARELENK